MVEGFRLSAVWLDSLFIASVPSHALAPGPIRLRYTQSCGTGGAAGKMQPATALLCSRPTLGPKVSAVRIPDLLYVRFDSSLLSAVVSVLYSSGPCSIIDPMQPYP